MLPQYGTEIGKTSSADNFVSYADETENENGFYPQEREKPVENPDSIENFNGFSGVRNLSEMPKFGNSQQNLTGCPAYFGVVCADEDTVYYTALGYDNFPQKNRANGRGCS